MTETVPLLACATPSPRYCRDSVTRAHLLTPAPVHVWQVRNVNAAPRLAGPTTRDSREQAKGGCSRASPSDWPYGQLARNNRKIDRRLHSCVCVGG